MKLFIFTSLFITAISLSSLAEDTSVICTCELPAKYGMTYSNILGESNSIAQSIAVAKSDCIQQILNKQPQGKNWGIQKATQDAIISCER